MAFRFFVVPIGEDSEAETQLNAFLATHKVLNVDRRWVDQGSQSFWSFCIDYVPGAKPRTGASGGNEQRERIDYREKLPPEQFRVFAALRDLRKEIAQAEAVPVYTIFTNEQLAQMVTTAVTSKAGLDYARRSRYWMTSAVRGRCMIWPMTLSNDASSLTGG